MYGRARISYVRTMIRPSALLTMAFVVAGCGGNDSDGSGDDKCAPDDADGLTGGDAAFELDVFDDRFDPMILTAQDRTKITLTLHNMGTKPHDFVTDCVPTPNQDGCPMTSCFPMSAKIAPLGPGESAKATFVVPIVEGIYYYHSDVAGDVSGACAAGVSGCGQFIVK
jgi:hypothetical protein